MVNIFINKEKENILLYIRRLHAQEMRSLLVFSFNISITKSKPGYITNRAQSLSDLYPYNSPERNAGQQGDSPPRPGPHCSATCDTVLRVPRSLASHAKELLSVRVQSGKQKAFHIPNMKACNTGNEKQLRTPAGHRKDSWKEGSSP